MKKHPFLISFLVVLLLMSCQTSKTFYGTTYSNLEVTKNVYRLDLSSYQKEIDLSEFSELRMLNLSNVGSLARLTTILNTIPNPDQLEVLLLNNNQLKTLPSSLLRFKALKQLSLHKNPNLDLKTAFMDLSSIKLEFLSLQENQLSQVPKEIGLLRTLKEINLSQNNLSETNFFDDLAELPELQSLWLRNNGITVLNTSLSKLSQLVHLYLEHNQLKELPNNLKGLKSLRVLHLSFNQFEELPENLQNIPKLILLHIDHCYIQTIPHTFGPKTTSIKGLVMNANALSSEDLKKWKSVFKNNFLLIF